MTWFSLFFNFKLKYYIESYCEILSWTFTVQRHCLDHSCNSPVGLLQFCNTSPVLTVQHTLVWRRAIYLCTTWCSSLASPGSLSTWLFAFSYSVKVSIQGQRQVKVKNTVFCSRSRYNMPFVLTRECSLFINMLIWIYNKATLTPHLYCKWLRTILLSLLDSFYDTFHTTADMMYFCQMMAVAEVINPALGLVRTGVLPALIQVQDNIIHGVPGTYKALININLHSGWEVAQREIMFPSTEFLISDICFTNRQVAGRNVILFVIFGSLEEMQNRPVVFFVFYLWSSIEIFRYLSTTIGFWTHKQYCRSEI